MHKLQKDLERSVCGVFEVSLMNNGFLNDKKINVIMQMFYQSKEVCLGRKTKILPGFFRESGDLGNARGDRTL